MRLPPPKMAIFLLPAPAWRGGGERAEVGATRANEVGRREEGRGGHPRQRGGAEVRGRREGYLRQRRGAKVREQMGLPVPAGRGGTKGRERREDYPRQRDGATGRERREGYPRQQGGAEVRGRRGGAKQELPVPARWGGATRASEAGQR